MSEKIFAAGKTTGFVVGVFVFFFVFINLFFNPGFWHNNLLLLAELFAAAIIINLAVPRALKKLGEKKFSAGIEAGGMLFAQKLNNTIVFAALLITYIVAVGFVAIIAKLFGKKFLQLKKSNAKSHWIEKKPFEEKDYFKNPF